MNTQQKIDSLVAKILELRTGVLNSVQKLPDNNKITRLSPNFFIMKWSDLSNVNWSPTYYDYQRQYKLIADSLQRTEIENVLKKLERIIEEKKVKVYHRIYPYYINLNPEVIEHLKRVLT